MFVALNNRQEMVACQLAHLAGKASTTIGEQYLGFAHAARIKQNIPARGMARVIFVIDTQLEIAQGNPAGFAAPTGVDEFLAVRQQASERRAGLWSGPVFHARGKGKRSSNDTKHRRHQAAPEGRPISTRIVLRRSP